MNTPAVSCPEISPSAKYEVNHITFITIYIDCIVIQACLLSQPVDECKEETPIDVVGDNDIKQEPDFPEVKFTLAGTTESSMDGMEET